MRINARLDKSTQEQLDYLRTTTRQSVTEIVRQGLSLYYQQIKSQSEGGTRRLLESDFIGCCEGPEDLSSDYKRYLQQGTAEKHGHNLLLID